MKRELFTRSVNGRAENAHAEPIDWFSAKRILLNVLIFSILSSFTRLLKWTADARFA